LQFTYQEPYFRNRPISVGFSLFASRYRFFGEGTLLTQNPDVIEDLFDPLAQYTTESRNLFTQTTIGGNLFATAPLSELFFRKRQFTQFSRVGLTYQFSATSIADPEVNEDCDASTCIPVLYETPNIITSRVIGSFVYDTRQPAANGIDTNSGSQLSLSMALAGLGGDVRTYQPNISYSRFMPVRRRKSRSPEVFAFRVQAGTIGSFGTTDKIRNANSISFIGGVPINERYFLGSENDIRGYTSRAIGPFAPFDTYITSRNVVAATNLTGTATAPSLDPRTLADLGRLGALTGPDGANPALFRRNFQFIGGDTQILGNFEYRIPIFGPATVALFADVGSVFNLRNTGTQRINTEFFDDDRFIGQGTLTALSLVNAPALENSFGSLLYYRGRVLTRTDFINEFCRGNRFGCPTSLSPEVQQIYLRGEAQQNSLLRVDDAVFNKFSDFRSSVGVELRVQVPIVNVPFRLIYYYNPNARLGFTEELPGIFLRGKRNGVRFTVGRTF
ncbi:MAG: BamA/TamA family outer membrane protein, partial [Acidobacteria bacterium]|nr:BamA/TamA family outer membrane protein [Acidobacteriota bacterium]